jgi:hypothetical protein
MALPSRKKIKGFATNVVDFSTVKPTVSRDPLTIQTDHDSGASALSLHQFAEGTLDDITYPLIKTRFTGRPILIAQLAPHIQSKYGDKKNITAKNIITILRRWWVFFDSIIDEQQVNSIEDIDDFIGFRHIRVGALSSNYRTDFLALINAARLERGLPKLYWPGQDDDTPAGHLPHFPHVKVIYHELKQRMKFLTARWELADELAKFGKDWSGGLHARHSKIHGSWTDAETHATYRGAIARLECPTPSRDQLKCLLARPSASAITKMVDAIEGLYPRQTDVQYLLYLFLLRSGWNATTALELVVGSCIIEHPTSSAHHVVLSIKNRGETEQSAIGLNKSQFSPGSILRMLIARTAPLRAYLQAELTTLEEAIDSGGNAETLERMRLLRRMVNSPWLYSTRGGEIRFLTMANYLPISDGGVRGSGLQLIVEKLNLNRSTDDQIDTEMSVGDFRDAYISFAYESSGYSWLVAKLAAGHSSLESLRTYLRKRHFKAHGEKKVHAWNEALWSEIRMHRRVDPAILHARVQRGEISDEERARWTLRTHVGTGCQDFKHPPSYISPEHKDGDGCRVQRCTLCHHAILFDDSCDLLSRRLMELAHIQRTIPLLAWMQSSFPLEVENIELALGQFDSKTVEDRKRFWEEEIKSGRYIPLSFEGSY